MSHGAIIISHINFTLTFKWIVFKVLHVSTEGLPEKVRGRVGWHKHFAQTKANSGEKQLWFWKLFGVVMQVFQVILWQAWLCNVIPCSIFTWFAILARKTTWAYFPVRSSLVLLTMENHIIIKAKKGSLIQW